MLEAFTQNAIWGIILSTITINIHQLGLEMKHAVVCHLGSILKVDGCGRAPHLCARGPPPGQYHCMYEKDFTTNTLKFPSQSNDDISQKTFDALFKCTHLNIYHNHM